MGCTRATPDDDVLVHEKVPEFCMDFPSAKSGLRELLPGLASVLLLGGLRLKPFVEQIFHALVVVEFSRFPPSMSSGDLLDDPSAGRVS